MYESPIKLMIEDVSEQLIKEKDKLIVRVLERVRPDVDISELQKALNYERNQYEKGEWDMFDLITSSYYGKNYYFLQDDGTVYSRASHKTFASKDDAYAEFLKLIGE